MTRLRIAHRFSRFVGVKVGVANCGRHRFGRFVGVRVDVAP